jgi:tRNA (cytidine/uridine-2'-O-)-methyltransferase
MCSAHQHGSDSSLPTTLPADQFDREGQFAGSSCLFHVTLVEPEIPNNTGNIGRTCVALGCSLHLVHPLGFDTSEKACRRAGLDYWPRLPLRHYANWHDYTQRSNHQRLWLLTTKAKQSVFDVQFCKGDALVFGKETRGLDDALLAQYPESCVCLPMIAGERSLNLATAVCAVVFEGVRQAAARGECRIDQGGRLVP